MVQYLEAQLKLAQMYTHFRLSLSNPASLLQTVEYKICETMLESVTSQRHLGVVVTNTLSWSLHYGKLCQKAYMLFISLKDHFLNQPQLP